MNVAINSPNPFCSNSVEYFSRLFNNNFCSSLFSKYSGSTSNTSNHSLKLANPVSVSRSLARVGRIDAICAVTPRASASAAFCNCVRLRNLFTFANSIRSLSDRSPDTFVVSVRYVPICSRALSDNPPSKRLTNLTRSASGRLSTKYFTDWLSIVAGSRDCEYVLAESTSIR